MNWSGQSRQDLRDTSGDGSYRDETESRAQKEDASVRAALGQTFSSGTEPPYGNQEPSSFNRAVPIGSKGGPPMSPGVFIPPFSSPVVWSGARGVEMNMLGVPPVLPGPFPPNLGNHAMYFNQPGPGRGAPPNMSGPNFNALIPAVVDRLKIKLMQVGCLLELMLHLAKLHIGVKQNDCSQNFVDTGTRPQNFIRELELTSVVEDYPKLRELIQRKDEIVWEEYVHRAPGVTDHIAYWTFEEIMNLKIEAIADTSFVFLWVGDGVGIEQGRQCLKKWGFRRCEDICWVKTNKTNATPGLRHDSHTLFQRSKEHCLLGIKGTVPHSTDGHIIHANIDTDVIIAEEPPYGRTFLIPDIYWKPGLLPEFSYWSPYAGSTAKPEDMYRIIEHFALGRRRLELFGEDHNIRSGWLTVGKGLSSSNFSAETYVRNFADRDGKVWQGGGGRNPTTRRPTSCYYNT
ncbi:hypothetical protein RND71_029004 [Anisodus tanguticus]|uniref:Uncharacterized protein n=1 Tax=Anisodus tanguticus TaxID=243964 RepID=A0AAE1V7M0_9SOLA|nr:hypothetical protein RND71_029004 [Anisodus tanguticus]